MIWLSLSLSLSCRGASQKVKQLLAVPLCSLFLSFLGRRRERRTRVAKALARPVPAMSSSGFQRPGTRSSGKAFGISLSVDSAVSASGQAAAIDASKSSSTSQLSTAAVSSAVSAAKSQILFLIERHAVVVVQGEPNGGKADKARVFLPWVARKRSEQSSAFRRRQTLTSSLPPLSTEPTHSPHPPPKQ